jgi:hypothetical protein
MIGMDGTSGGVAQHRTGEGQKRSVYSCCFPHHHVAADHPETARRALEKIAVEYEVFEPLTDAEEAMSEEAPRLHLSGNLLRHIHTVHGGEAYAPPDAGEGGEG